MKKYYLIIPFILSCYSCSLLNDKTNNENKYALYESFGESGGYKYLMKNQFFYKIVDSTKFKTKINHVDWNLLKKEINNINIDSLSEFKAPSDDREVDGAWYTRISIGINENVYYSPYYDDGNPNKKLKKLDSMLTLTIRKYNFKLPKKSLKRDNPYSSSYVDKKAKFGNKPKEFYKYIYSRINQKTKDKSIKAFTQFIISEKGKIQDLRIRCEDSLIKKELFNILQSMPKWKAAKINGIKVKTFENRFFVF